MRAEIESAGVPLSNRIDNIQIKEDIVKEISGEIIHSVNLKNSNIADNKSKLLASIAKLEELDLSENRIADRHLLEPTELCRRKQIGDRVKQHAKQIASSSKLLQSVVAKNNIQIQRFNDDTIKVIVRDLVKDVRPFILCCIVKNVNLGDGNLKKFLQIQSKLHETVCGKRKKSTIATHDLAKFSAGDFIQYTAKSPDQLTIVPLGRSEKVIAEKFYDELKTEAEALRKEKKRKIHSGIYKYLYLLENQFQFACIEDAAGNVISWPPLTNGELTKISPETTEVFLEVTSSTSMANCRLTIEELLQEMLLAGLGSKLNQSPVKHLTVQQVESTDIEGNLLTIYPSNTDLQFDECKNIQTERE